MAFLALGTAVGVLGGWAGGQVGAILRRRQPASQRAGRSLPEGGQAFVPGQSPGLAKPAPAPPAGAPGTEPDLVLSLASPGAQRSRSAAPSFACLSQSPEDDASHPTWNEAYSHFARLAAEARSSAGFQPAPVTLHLSVHNTNDARPPPEAQPVPEVQARVEAQPRDLEWLKKVVQRELMKGLALILGWEAAKAHVAGRRRAAAAARLEGAPPLARLLAQARGGAPPWAGRGGKGLFLLQ